MSQEPSPRRVSQGKPRASARGRKPAGKPRSADAERLDRLARRLEADWQTALRHHEAGVRRRFRELRTAAHKRPTSKRLERAIACLEPRLKPKRGRAKDLRRVAAALDEAIERLG